MKTVCCKCGTHIKGDKQAKTISHSYCAKCHALEVEKIKQFKEKMKNESTL